MSYIMLDNNIKLFVQDWGSGEPVAFISGWPFDHRSYEYQFNTIPQAGFRCIGIDMRGFGYSDKPWGTYNYDVFADDVHKVLQHLGVKSCTLVGHSMGGAIALHYGAKYGTQFVSKLMLCGAAAPTLSQKPDFPHGWTKAEIDGALQQCDTDRAKLLTDFGKKFFYKPDSLTPELAQWFWITGMDASPYATAQCIKLFDQADLRPDMAKINMPTLIAHARHDKVCTYALGETLHKNIEGSTLVTFEKSGHGLFYDEREKFNKTLIDFANQ